MKRASIDIGSNSVLLLAAFIQDGKIIKELLDESSITSLGKDLDKTGVFHPDSMKATFDALKKYSELCVKNGINPSEVIVTATEASRVAKNSPDFYKKIQAETGFKTQIISSVGEAYYTALGVASSQDERLDSIVIMDIGGASTELIKLNLKPFQIANTISLPVGSVRGMDWRASGEFDKKINDLLSVDLEQYKTQELVCVAGSMTALASMYLGLKEFSAQKIEGQSISFQNFCDFSEDLQKTNIENLLLLFPFLGKRAPMVSSGALVAQKIAEKLNVAKLKISTRGLRYGTVLSGGIDERFISN